MRRRSKVFLHERDVVDAYAKLKSHTYFDNSSQLLRAQIAEFENSANIHHKFGQLANAINEYLKTGEISSYIKDLLDQISYTVFPKSFRSSTEEKDSAALLISNQLRAAYEVDRQTIFFTGPIECQLIAVLWIVNASKKLGQLIGQDSYGYHLPNGIRKDANGHQKVLFTKYFEKYQEWRNNGINKAMELVKNRSNALLLSLDIKDFFYSCRIDFDELRSDLEIVDGPTLLDLIEEIMNRPGFSRGKVS